MVPYRERELPFEARLAAHEEGILRIAAISFRGMRDPDLVRLGNIAGEVQGKVVADFGSGYGGLARSASVEGIDTTIWSINPNLRHSTVAADLQDHLFMKGFLRNSYPDVTDEQVAAAAAYHDSHTSTNFAHRLTDFPDNFFDVGIDNYAVHAYMPIGEPEIYDLTIGEMLRVMKPGGKIIVGHGGKEELWTENGIGRRGLSKRGLLYNPIYWNNTAGHPVWVGGTIVKPQV